MLPKVVKHNGAHELFMNTYGRRRRRRSTVLLYRFGYFSEEEPIDRGAKVSEAIHTTRFQKAKHHRNRE